MIEPPLLPDEAARLAALRAYDVLDTTAEASFDAITELVGLQLDAPIVLISLIDADRQWFKSRRGLDAPETPRAVSFCGHAIAGRSTFVVPDARADVRFADNPLVVGNPQIRFYAGAPLVSPEGAALGTLCAIDVRPRELTAREARALELLADQVMKLFELRRAAAPPRCSARSARPSRCASGCSTPASICWPRSASTAGSRSSARRGRPPWAGAAPSSAPPPTPR
jgi:hypothetical protein